VEQRLLVQQLLTTCQNLRQEAEINLELAAECFQRARRRSLAGEKYVSDAYQNIHDLERALDKLASVAIDYEVLFEHFYDQAMYIEQKERRDKK